MGRPKGEEEDEDDDDSDSESDSDSDDSESGSDDKRPAKPKAKPPAKAAPAKAPAKAAPAKAPAKAAPAKAAAQAVEESESESESESGSGESGDDDDSESSEGLSKQDLAALQKKKEAKERREQRLREQQEEVQRKIAAGEIDNLRSPICCIMGHVDTGKTKLLDKIRQTDVQGSEAGGITQQIGATFFPMSEIKKKTERLMNNMGKTLDSKLPGLLIIDTPGHESFQNLRQRGSSLCDIAILVVDIMHGLEPQTIESLNMLRKRKSPFIVALNKVDRLYDWKVHPDFPIQETLKLQSEGTLQEYETRLASAILALTEQGLNCEVYYKQKDFRKTVAVVPTSAVTGEGVCDMQLLIVQLTQKMMAAKLTFIKEVQCTVLEVKVIEGLGTTIDVVLVNGVLNEGDTIVVCGLNGPIVTSVRALLTPQPMKELRVKGAYVHHPQIKAAMGIKISAHDLGDCIAGSPLMVLGTDDDIEDLKDEVMSDYKEMMAGIAKTGRGVAVQASTLGSLEALLSFLKTSEIPVSAIAIGPVHKKDVIRASIMLEHQKEYAVILAFDVGVDSEAAKLAENLGVKIFTAEIIYHLFDQFTAYMEDFRRRQREEVADEAVFPCVLRILPECIFNKRDPIVLGVEVVAGILKLTTPICVPQCEGICIGRIASIEKDHKPVEKATKGQAVAIKIQQTSTGQEYMFGRHFDHTNELVSQLTRRSIDLLKENFKDALKKEDWQVVIKLKTLLNIQ